MGVLENWYINLTNCLHVAARLFPELLCRSALVRLERFPRHCFCLTAPQRPFCSTFPTFSKSLFNDMYCFGKETAVPLFTETHSIAEKLFGLLRLQTRNGATPGLLIHSPSPLSIASKTPETKLSNIITRRFTIETYSEYPDLRNILVGYLYQDYIVKAGLLVKCQWVSVLL